ncbi:hypothetical protein [Frigoribacterium sp. CFBP9030]|uniref:hypothetical protein n=1 Tax=Frigoribacterium sp. CFBP9030 TaxID=3096537 RepID=UPI002A6B46F4|nr:hypothetical protein [Frigoribacterium sp. CFBP9030]MDY0891852.1 hypothetical protein [Frigoribacterium sp. CFBP9030]
MDAAEAPFGPGQSPQYRKDIDIDIVGDLSMAANALADLEESGTVDLELLRVVRHLHAAVRDLAIYTGIDYS